VDPLKDIQANREAIAQRVRSISSVIRETGNDPDDVFDEIQQERLKMESMGIEPEHLTASAAQTEQNNETEPAQADDRNQKHMVILEGRIDKLSSKLDSYSNTEKIIKKVESIKPLEISKRAEPIINVNVPAQEPPIVNIDNQVDVHVPRQETPVVNIENKVDVPMQPVPDIRVDVTNEVKTPTVNVDVNIPDPDRIVTFGRDKNGKITSANITDD